MSRWLWALLGGVVLVAIAAVFWIASNQTNVTPPVSPGPAPVSPAPVPPAPPAPAPVAQQPAPSPAPAPSAQEAAPSPAPSPSPPAAHEAAAPPALAPIAPPAPTPAPAPAPPAPPVVAQEPPPPPAPAPLAEAPLSPAPGRETQEVQGEYAPKSLAQLVGAWAYSTEDCNRLFEQRGGGWAYRQPLDKFAQAAIVEPKRILLPSATCRVEGASEAEGALKVSAECADSITYTPRSVMITLRSPTELLYSASGDPLLATALKKCPP